MMRRWMLTLGLALGVVVGAPAQDRQHSRGDYETFFGDLECQEFWFDSIEAISGEVGETAIDGLGIGNCNNRHRNSGRGERHISRLIGAGDDGTGFGLIDDAVGTYKGGDQAEGYLQLINAMRMVAPLPDEEPLGDQFGSFWAPFAQYYRAQEDHDGAVAPDPGPQWPVGSELVGSRGGVAGRGTNERGDLDSGGEINDAFDDIRDDLVDADSEVDDWEILRDRMIGTATAMGLPEPDRIVDKVKDGCTTFGEVAFVLEMRDTWISYLRDRGDVEDPALVPHLDFTLKPIDGAFPANEPRSTADDLGELHKAAETAFGTCFEQKVDTLLTCSSMFANHGRAEDTVGDDTVVDYVQGREGYLQFCAERYLAAGNLDDHPSCTLCIDMAEVEAAAASEDSLRSGCRAAFEEAGQAAYEAGRIEGLDELDEEVRENRVILAGRQEIGRECAEGDSDGEFCDCFDEDELGQFTGEEGDEEMTGAGGGSALEEMTGEIDEGPSAYSSYEDCVAGYTESREELGEEDLAQALEPIVVEGQEYPGRLTDEGIHLTCAAAFEISGTSDGADYRPRDWDERDAQTADRDVQSTEGLVGGDEGNTQAFLEVSWGVWLGSTAEKLAAQLCAGADDPSACVAEYRIWEPGGLIDYLSEANYGNVGFDRFIAGHMLWVPPERCLSEWKDDQETGGRNECGCFYSQGNQSCPRCDELPVLTDQRDEAREAASEAGADTGVGAEYTQIADALEGEIGLLEDAECEN